MDLMVLAMARKYMDKKVAELVSAGWTKQIVKELPTTGNDKTIYMVEKVDNAGNTYYDEYMYTNGKFDGIGTTRVDLNGYATKDELNGKENTLVAYNGIRLDREADYGFTNIFVDTDVVATKVELNTKQDKLIDTPIDYVLLNDNATSDVYKLYVYDGQLKLELNNEGGTN